MREKNLEEEKKNLITPPSTPYSIVKFCLIIIVVVALGLFAINQFFAWHYKIVFLKTPCDLCMELNPHLECRLGIQPIEILNPNYKIENKIINNFSP